jgi:hypothetical protein
LRFINITLGDIGDVGDVSDIGDVGDFVYIPYSFPNPNPNIFFTRFKTIGEEVAEAEGDKVVDIIGQA